MDVRLPPKEEPGVYSHIVITSETELLLQPPVLSYTFHTLDAAPQYTRAGAGDPKFNRYNTCRPRSVVILYSLSSLSRTRCPDLYR